MAELDYARLREVVDEVYLNSHSRSEAELARFRGWLVLLRAAARCYRLFDRDSWDDDMCGGVSGRVQ